MPVYQLSEEMPYDEYVRWAAYFEARPIGWREDDRTYKLLMAQGVKARSDTLFESLAKMKAFEEKTMAARREGEISVANLKRSALFKNLLGAQGGDSLEILR